MEWESFGIGLLAGLAAWTPLATLLVWRLRAARPDPRPIHERVQTALLDKIAEIPADDLDRIRDYLREIDRLQPNSPAEGRRSPSAVGEAAPQPQ